MKRLTANEKTGQVKLCCALHGEGAYEKFKGIASEFYNDRTYKFVSLTLDGNPTPASVEFEAEFWSVPSEAATQLANDPLTLEELREMDGEPVFIMRIGSDEPTDRDWALVDLKHGMCRTVTGGMAIFELYGASWLAYRRKPEGANL